MFSEYEKVCINCRKKGLVSKCGVCITTFKKVELFLKKKQELAEELLIGSKK